jgi:glucokinase-like ROK family protein
MRTRTGNHGFLRKQNLAGVLQRIYEDAPISRIELSRRTGLNKATISSLVNDLVENRYIWETGEGTDRRAGRREVMLELNPRGGCMVSAEIGVGFISVLCTDFTARIIWRSMETIESSDPKAVIDLTLKLMNEARREGGAKCDRLLGSAVGLPGLIDQKSGKLLIAPNLGWRDVEVLESLKESFDVPIFIDNEATFAALGERYFGVARGHNNVLYISAGVGIGGGLIIDGRIYGGSGGFASEFGHMTMDPGGIKCGCGNTGCWETQASQAALFRYIHEEIADGKVSAVSKKHLKKLSIEAVVGAAEQGDAVALAALRKTANYLATGIDSLVKAFDPEIVVFGGILSLAGKFLFPTFDEVLGQDSMLESRLPPRVMLAEFGSDAAAMGGIARIFQSILAMPPLTERLTN